MNKIISQLMLAFLLGVTTLPGIGATATFAPDTTTELDTNNERGWYYIPKAAEWCNGSLQTFRDGQGAIPQKARLFYYEWLPGSSSATVTSDLACVRAAGVKVMFAPVYCDVQFCNEGVTISQLESQMAAIATTLLANRDVIAVFRMGLIGAFGEWADSGAGLDTVANKIRVRNSVLSSIPPEIPIVTRHPWDLVSWYPTPTSVRNAFTADPVSRFGVFNDCYESNPDDQFTYPTSVPVTVVDLVVTQTPAQTRGYAASQTRYAPFGGETCDSAGAVNRINCVGGLDNAGLVGGISMEGPRYHQTFLHRGYFVDFYNNWQTQAGGNCYASVTNLLGYRFQYDNLTHPDTIAQGATASFILNMRNYGWGIINSLRQVQVRLVKSGANDIVCEFSTQLRTLPPQATSSSAIKANCPIAVNATVGSYDAYLEIPDVFPRTEVVKTYRIQPANANSGGQIWDATNRRFATGTHITITTP